MNRSKIAAELCLPASELDAMPFGLVMTAGESAVPK
jgi:hypothetical protein